jgi:murein DD-endopeptidase MepM/ murein hydrolase activator NlpD
MISPRKVGIWLLVGLFLVSACSPTSSDVTPTVSVELQPFATFTPSPTPSAPYLVTPGAPLPTATPFVYNVVSGDTLLGIALKFGISLEDLMAANPGVQPSVLPDGQELHIPSSAQNQSSQPTPTPVPLDVTQVRCYPTAEQGLWCFALVHNSYPDSLENLSAQISLLDEEGKTLVSQTAISPLNILPPGQAIPLMAFFPPEVASEAHPQIQLLTGIRLLSSDERYLPAVTQNTLARVDWSGKTAQVSGQVVLLEKGVDASQIWVAAVVYDAAGNVVGVRRWESNGKLEAGGDLSFDFTVSSLAGAITRVEFVVEARP